MSSPWIHGVRLRNQRLSLHRRDRRGHGRSSKPPERQRLRMNAAEEWKPILSELGYRTWRACFGPWVGSDWTNVSLHQVGQFFRKQLITRPSHYHAADTEGPAWKHGAGDGWHAAPGPEQRMLDRQVGHLRDGQRRSDLRSFPILRVEVWHEWLFSSRELQPHQPKWVTTTNTQPYQPTQATPVPNLVLAGAHTRTAADVWSIEGAVEQRSAAQVIATSVKVIPQHKPLWLRAMTWTTCASPWEPLTSSTCSWSAPSFCSPFCWPHCSEDVAPTESRVYQRRSPPPESLTRCSSMIRQRHPGTYAKSGPYKR